MNKMQKSIKESLEMSCSAGVAQLSERLRLDLTDSLSCNVEFLSDLLQRSASAIVKSEAQSDNVRLTGGKRTQFLLYHLAQNST